MSGIWELQEANRVQVIILHTEIVTMPWALSLRNLIVPGPPVLPLAGMPFDMARNMGNKIALERGCEWAFHLDSDLCVPRDTILRLMARNKPLISGVYFRRSPPEGVPVMQRKFQWLTEFPPNQVIEVDWVGSGCMLIHRSLLENMKPPPDAPHKRWFRWRVDEQGYLPHGEAASEDFVFCNRVKREFPGSGPFVDTSIVATRHIGLAQATYGSFRPAESNPNPI